MPNGEPATKISPAAKTPKRNTSILGKSRIFTPEVIDDIHIKSELGRYRMRGFSLFKKIPHWDDLTFLPGTLTRFVIEGYREKCQTRTVIGPRAKRLASANARPSLCEASQADRCPRPALEHPPDA